VKPQEFRDALDSQNFKPFYLFCPAKTSSSKTDSFEPVLVQESIRYAVDRFVDPSIRDLAYSVFYADEADPKDIVATAATLPFLSEKRIVVVQRAESLLSENAAAPLFEYLENPSETTLLLLVASQIDRRSKLFKLFDKTDAVVECGELKKNEIIPWAREKAASLGKTISTEAIDELINRTGTGLGDIGNAIELLSAYVEGERSNIEKTDVQAVCAVVREEEIWALTDAIASSDTSKAIQVLHEILDAGTHELQVLGSINWLLESAYALAAGGSSARKIHAYAAQRIRPLAEKIPLKKFPAAFSLCMETDLMLRSTGVNRTLASLALELLIVKLSAPRTKTTAKSASNARKT